MNEPKSKRAGIRARVEELLSGDEFEAGLPELARMPARSVINPLFASLCNPDEVHKMRAAKAMGVIVAGLAEEDAEAARVIMRRFMWNLNDESGGIGWGSPEAMGEIMAVSEKLAQEYSHILVSYLREDGNFLEHPVLQRGVLWALARLAGVRPRLVRKSVDYILPYLDSDDAVLRGLAAKIVGSVALDSARPQLALLVQDQTRIDIFENGRMRSFTISELAKEAIQSIEQARSIP